LPHHGDRSQLGKVGEQYAYHSERQGGVGREVGHGDLLVAQTEQPAVLGVQPDGIIGRR